MDCQILFAKHESSSTWVLCVGYTQAAARGTQAWSCEEEEEEEEEEGLLTNNE